MNNNLIYVFQSFLADFGPESTKEYYSVSSNKNSSLLTITVKENGLIENFMLQVYQLDTTTAPLTKFF